MPFLFTLHALLRVREIEEKAELQRLQIMAAQIASARSEIASLDAGAERARRTLWEESPAGMSGAELQFSVTRDVIYRERRRTLAARLQELEQAQQTQQARYLKARQQREILSHLREQQLAAYEVDQSRKAQRQMDELFLLRQAGRKNA